MYLEDCVTKFCLIAWLVDVQNIGTHSKQLLVCPMSLMRYHLMSRVIDKLSWRSSLLLFPRKKYGYHLAFSVLSWLIWAVRQLWRWWQATSDLQSMSLLLNDVKWILNQIKEYQKFETGHSISSTKFICNKEECSFTRAFHCFPHLLLDFVFRAIKLTWRYFECTEYCVGILTYRRAPGQKCASGVLVSEALLQSESFDLPSQLLEPAVIYSSVVTWHHYRSSTICLGGRGR